MIIASPGSKTIKKATNRQKGLNSPYGDTVQKKKTNQNLLILICFSALYLHHVKSIIKYPSIETIMVHGIVAKLTPHDHDNTPPMLITLCA